MTQLSTSTREKRQPLDGHGDEVDEWSAGLRVVDQTRLTLLAGLDMLTHMPLQGRKKSVSILGPQGQERRISRTAALPSVYLRGAPWTVPPPGVCKNRQFLPMISSFE